MKVYLLQMDCGDYYCDGEHPAGVFSSRERAEAALVEALALTPEDHDYRLYEAGTVREMELDAGVAQHA